ncbi:MAG: NUDIX hydrolase [Anaerolineae bacterium]|nr:NUDIX hydrolase [Anaerolineae bacterium]
MTEWKTLDSRLVLEHPYLRVTLDAVELPDGTVIPDWPIASMQDYVNVVVLNAVNELLVLEGYGHGFGRICWQVVGGLIDPGEDPLTAAKRELLEEAGLECAQWEALGRFVGSKNRYFGTGHLFLARHPTKVAEGGTGDLETYTLNWVPLTQVREALFAGKIGGTDHALNFALALLKLER